MLKNNVIKQKISQKRATKYAVILQYKRIISAIRFCVNIQKPLVFCFFTINSLVFITYIDFKGIFVLQVKNILL